MNRWTHHDHWLLREHCLILVLLFSFASLYAQEELKTWKSEGLRGRVRRVTTYSLQWPDERQESEWRGLTFATRVDYDSLGRGIAYAASNPEEADAYQTYRYDSLGRLSVVTEHLVKIEGDSIVRLDPRSLNIDDLTDSSSADYYYVLDDGGKVIERRFIVEADSSVIHRTRFYFDSAGRPIADSTTRGVGGGFTNYDYSSGVLRRKDAYDVILSNPPMLTGTDEYDSSGTLIRHTWYGCCESPWYRTTSFVDGRESTVIEQTGPYRKEGYYDYEDDKQGNWVRQRYWQRDANNGKWLLFIEQRRAIVYW